MRMVPICWRALATGVVLAWAGAPALLPAAPAAPVKDDKTVNPADKLRDGLDKVVTIKFVKQPLNAALDMLRDASNVRFVVDSLTIQQQLGFTPDMPPVPVDGEFKNAKVRDVLRAILAPYNLSYAPVGDEIVVTTEDMAMYRQMRQKVNVDFTKVDFTTALRQMAKETATNLILDGRAEKDASAKVTLQLEDVPLDTAVRLLSEMAGLKPVRVGNVLFVTKKEIANELRNDPDLVQPVQPGQPVPPGGGAPLIGALPNPPPLITAPPAPPAAVPPAVGSDSGKLGDDKPPVPEDKPKTDDSKPKDSDKKDGV